ncbi:hypothetical protein HY968_03880 [Candidatus Kaiserbacteria bacterium]|nr:hypothetical protein [Candidatus Kaiserbacteria bacterium]
MTTFFNKKNLALACICVSACMLFISPHRAEAACLVSPTGGIAIGSCGFNDVSAACRGGGTCDSRDQNLLSILGSQCDGPRAIGCNAPGLTLQQDADAAKALMKSNTAATPQKANSTDPTQPPECAEAGYFGGETIACQVLRVTFSVLAGIMFMFARLLEYTDQLFSLTLKQFATSSGWNEIYPHLSDGINNVWTFVRDLANIMMIGLFVFIAISIILGLKEYGHKKLIARVLVVAVLINFSFLFTKIVINASNAFSQSIYTQLVSKNAVTANATGIGDQFTKLLDTASLQNSTTALNKIYSQNNAGAFGWVLLHTVESVLFMLGAILALLFGVLLIVSRFVTLILLLILSSLAFATYLIPNWAAMGWTAWWNHLIKNALLAPVLMLFLWAAITVSGGVHTQLMSSGSLGDPSNVQGILGYLVILGLLLAGMIIAYKLSTASALRFVTAIPAIGLGLATAGVGNVFGFYSKRAAIGYDADMKNENLSDRQRRAAARGKYRNEQWANRDWNLMNSAAAKFAAKIPGLGGLEVGKFKSTPYGKRVDEKAAKLGTIYGGLAPSKEKIAEVRKEASKDTDKDLRQKEQLIATRDQARAAEKRADDQHKEANEQLAQLTRIEKEIAAAKSAPGGGSPADIRRLEDERKTALQAAGGSIKTAQDRVNDRLKTLIKAQEDREKKEAAHDEGHQRIAKAQDLRAARAADSVIENVMPRGIIDPNLKALARKKITGYREDEQFKKSMKEWRRLDDEDKKGRPPPQPPTNPTQPAAPHTT